MAVSRRALSIRKALPPIRARDSWMPSKAASGTLNCSRMRAYWPVTRLVYLAAPVPTAGREIERPTDRQFISIIQPLPSMSWPPMRKSSGTNTSLPLLGPFMKAAPRGRWRLPISTPGVSVGISARLMPSSSLSPSRCSGS
ncbi:hypothetical protein D3C79_871030 [compost metagenome]